MAQLRPEKLQDHRRIRPIRRQRAPQLPPRAGIFDLRTQFPIAYRVVLKRSFAWVAGWLAFLAVIVALASISKGQLTSSPAGQIVVIGFALLTAAFIAKLTYEILYRSSYYYAIEAGHLVVSKGIVIRQRGSFPLSRITDVYLDRTVSDFIYGLYDLHISTPTVDSGRFARISGLHRDSAVRLQRNLVSLIEATHSSADRDYKRLNPKEEKIEKAVHED